VRKRALLLFVFLACSKSDDTSSPAPAGEDAGGPPIEAGNVDAGGDGASDDDDYKEGTFDDGTDDAGANMEFDASAGEGGCNQADIEPNGTVATARPLASTTDCDSNGNKIRGTISGSSDIDYFHFHGNDNFNCQVNPSATIDVSGVRLCMYAKCDNPTGSTSCGSGTADNAPPSGFAGGCCIDGPATLNMGVDCPGLDDSSTIYFKTSAVGSPVCKTYTITYHY